MADAIGILWVRAKDAADHLANFQTCTHKHKHARTHARGNYPFPNVRMAAIEKPKNKGRNKLVLMYRLEA